MIGYYSYTVILTYLSLISGVTGIYFAFSGIDGHSDWAILCLLVAGLFDLFDGKVARTKKNRTHNEKNFGIQIDSLNDVICFGVLPACIGYSVGMTKPWFIPVFAVYILAGLIRLAFFNVHELNQFYGYKDDETDNEEHCYYGMPITMSSLIVPAFYLLNVYMVDYFYIAYAILLGVLAICFVVKIRIPKPNKVGTIILAVGGTLICAALLTFFIIMRAE